MKHQKELMQLISHASHRFSTWDIFRDFVEMSALAMSNTVDLRHREQREAQYMELIKKYNERELQHFPKMLGELVMAMETGPGDILGRVYQELELANKWTGQFFTPDSICRLMGQMQVGDMKQKINEMGFITVLEPAIGGGAMIIALALALKESGINYQQSIVVTGVDIDIKSIHMSYLQLSLMHIPAVLIHGNTLTVEEWSHWYTPAFILGGWAYKRQRQKVDNVVRISKVKETFVPMSLFEAG